MAMHAVEAIEMLLTAIRRDLEQAKLFDSCALLDQLVESLKKEVPNENRTSKDNIGINFVDGSADPKRST